MLKRDNAIRQLIKDGYNEEIVNKLPQLYIEDYFDKGLEIVNESILYFIHNVQIGDVIPDENNNVSLACIRKIGERDNEDKYYGIFYNFKFHIKEEFIHTISRKPLGEMLVNAGVLERKDGYIKYNKEIVSNPCEYADLCEFIPLVPQVNYKTKGTIHVKAKDLMELLCQYFNEEDISIVYGEYGAGLHYPPVIPEEGVYIKYDAIMNLGKTVKNPKLVKE